MTVLQYGKWEALYNKEVFGGNANDEMKYVQFGNPATL
jgi:hypothetical protein